MLIDIQAVGLQIKRSRLQAGISQAEFARLADVSRATINGIENCTIKEIGVNRLNRVVAASRTYVGQFVKKLFFRRSYFSCNYGPLGYNQFVISNFPTRGCYE